MSTRLKAIDISEAELDRLEAIEDAVAAEREACARVAESDPGSLRYDAQRIAAAIRARGGQ